MLFKNRKNIVEARQRTIKIVSELLGHPLYIYTNDRDTVTTIFFVMSSTWSNIYFLVLFCSFSPTYSYIISHKMSASIFIFVCSFFVISNYSFSLSLHLAFIKEKHNQFLFLYMLCIITAGFYRLFNEFFSVYFLFIILSSTSET